MISAKDISSRYPIGAIALYKSAGIATTLRSVDLPEYGKPPKQPTRGKITHLSQKSLNRLIFLTQITTIKLRSMLTLTYLCPPVSGKKAKSDLRYILAWIKRRKKGNCNYVWFAEFTKAGSIHFHLLLECVPDNWDRVDLAMAWLKRTDQGRGEYCRLRDKRQMRTVVSIFSSVSHQNSWASLRTENGGKRYVAKYASKPYQKKVPPWFSDIGRFWGVSKGIKDNQEQPQIIEMNEDELREHLVRQKKSVGQWDVLPKYLWGVSEHMF